MEAAHTTDVSTRWARFARNETSRHSAVMSAWAGGVADDPEVCALVETLPERERQPNLVLAAARVVAPDLVDPRRAEARPDDYSRLRRVLLTRFGEIAGITATHHTQTNEPGRLAVLLPSLARLQAESGRELALIELGASAGLGLHPHAWRFRYVDRAGHELSAFGDPARPVVQVTVKDHPDQPDPAQVPPVPVPDDLPAIGWRLGLDLNPLDPRRDDDAAWLRTLVWPGQADRLDRLDAALAAAREDPVLVLRRDLTAAGVLDEVLRLVPPEFQPVVVHSAVFAYLDEDARRRVADDLLARVYGGALHWISNEGQSIVPQVAQAVARRPEFAARLRPGGFVVAVDGVPAHQADGHAAWVL